MPFIVSATQARNGAYVVKDCPSCGRTHRHSQAGTVTARCGMVYVVLATPAKQRRGR